MKKTLSKNKKLHNKKKKTVPTKVVKSMIQKKNVKTPAKVKVRTRTIAKAQDKVKKVVKVKAKKTKNVIAKAKVPATISGKKSAVQLASPAPAVTRGQTITGPVNVKPYQAEKNEEYMNKKQLEHFRQVLLQWKSQLMAEVDRTMHHMKAEVSNYPDPVDRASQEEEFGLELRARDRERKLLRKIEETLNRIKDNDYGYCDDCGAEIGVRRLEARPTATQCIECKTISEIREKQIGDSG